MKSSLGHPGNPAIESANVRISYQFIAVYLCVAHESKSRNKFTCSRATARFRSKAVDPVFLKPWKGDPTVAQGETLVVYHKSWPTSEPGFLLGGGMDDSIGVIRDV